MGLGRHGAVLRRPPLMGERLLGTLAAWSWKWRTYAVSFRVWPSQAACDLTAELVGGTKSYAELTDAEKDQIIAAEGGYDLYANSSATSYTPT